MNQEKGRRNVGKRIKSIPPIVSSWISRLSYKLNNPRYRRAKEVIFFSKSRLAAPCTNLDLNLLEIERLVTLIWTSFGYRKITERNVFLGKFMSVFSSANRR